MVARDPAVVVVPAGVAWSAVVGGALVALATQLVLWLVGLGFGLGVVDVAERGEAAAATITGGVALWWCVSAVSALFLGGWMAGRIAGGPFMGRGLTVGVLVWSLFTLGSLYLTTTSASTMLGAPLTVAADTVYGVLTEAENPLPEIVESGLPAAAAEEIREDRAAAARERVARAKGAMHAGLWAAVTLLLGAGAAVAGVWFATDPPAWSRPRA